MDVAAEFRKTAFTVKESQQNFMYWRWRKRWHTVENVFVYAKKLLQAIIVCTGKASGLLTGQETPMSAGLFIGTVILSSSRFLARKLKCVL